MGEQGNDPNTLKKCANCGGPAHGSVNGQQFCNDPKCVNAVMKLAVRPVLAAMLRQQQLDHHAM